MSVSQRIQWSDDSIKSEVMKVKDALCLSRMPTRKECKDFYGNTALTGAITRRYGWYALANELGLPIKDCETTTGKMAEGLAEKLLAYHGFTVKRMSQNFPYDILLNDCVKIDVKASKVYSGKNGDFYSFRLEKPYATCDFYILLELNERDEIDRAMVVPSHHVMFNKQISVGMKDSKYHRYTDRFDYLRDASSFWKRKFPLNS